MTIESGKKSPKTTVQSTDVTQQQHLIMLICHFGERDRKLIQT